MTECKYNFKFIDLFCGIGGFHVALDELGGECVLACDSDKYCREIYEKNYGITPLPDVRKIDTEDMPDFDVLCAGFPCFVSGTPVLTDSGYKNIEDVGLKDKLLTHSGNFQDIINLQRKVYSGDLYDIKVKYRPKKIKCTNEHPFYVRKRNRIWNNSIRKYEYIWDEPEWITAEKLNETHYVGMVVNNNNIIPEFNIKKQVNKTSTKNIQIVLDEPDMWFMMGYFLGDGWIEDTKKKDGRLMYKIRFAINNTDYDKVFSCISKYLPIKDKHCDSGEHCKKYGCSNQLWYNILKEFGKYAHGKRIPEWVQDAPIHLIEEFINGYITADGYVKGSLFEMTTVSENIAYGIQRLFLKLGKIIGINYNKRPKNTIIEGRVVNQRDTYKIRGYSVLKRRSYGSIIDNYAWFPINITSERVFDVPVYNFEVATDNSYIVHNVIAHNCQPFSNAGKKSNFGHKKGLLFDEVMRIARAKQPRFLFLENVKHIKKVSGGKVLKYIKEQIDNAGYHLQMFNMSPHEYGIPQQRERVYFVCVRRDIHDGSEVELLEPKTTEIDLSKFLQDKSEVSAKYFLDSGTHKYGDIKEALDAWEEMISIFPPGEKISPTIMANEFYKYDPEFKNPDCYSRDEFSELKAWRQDYIKKNRPLYERYKEQWDAWYERNREILQKREIYGKLEWQVGRIKPGDSIFNYFIQLRQSGIRVKKNKYFPTLVAMAQIPIYAREMRFLTPRECARIQSFPDTYHGREWFIHEKDNQSYKQFGNAVNVENVKNVIKSTFKTHFKSTLHISDIKKDGEQIKICFGPNNYCILTKEKILQLNQLINDVTIIV